MKANSQTTGLRYWMLRVLDECDRAAAGFQADPVHDLRVSLRRCRSMADGMMAMDPHPDWKAMKKAGRSLFRSLGELRDVQIMMDWIEKLEPKVEKLAASAASATPSAALQRMSDNPPERAAHSAFDRSGDSSQSEDRSQDHNKPARDPAAHALLGILRHRETEQKREARVALEEFDQKQWRHWSKTLPQRAGHIRPGSSVFKHLALERWTAARDLHNRAMRSRSQVALHATRIGIKRFRYIVENFLPIEHKLWSNDLKHMQDLLGEIHDLDVLWSTSLHARIFPDTDSRRRWHQIIVEERGKRLAEYREKMVGPNSLWDLWRAALPQGKQIQELATRRMKLWAKVLDSDFIHSERVARFSLELYDDLTRAGLLRPMEASNGQPFDARSSLFAGALLHDVGTAKGKKDHHKESSKLIQKHGVPLGWNEKDMQLAAIVARFHRGALPTRSHKDLRNLPPSEQAAVIRLAAILRLANAFDATHDGHIRRIRIENGIPAQGRSNGVPRRSAVPAKDAAVVLAAEGYAASSPVARTIAAERFPLETVLRRPVVVKAMKTTP
ncbi:MAG TPA: CHAD domain-containing protein [Verrucomicrobiae bacterium]|nr:CHAD domain-containing protein [Verrucomicrobiae bacterium]